MNKLFSKLKLPAIGGKRLYLFLLLVFIIGVLFGSIFITILDEQDKATILGQIATFFDEIKNNKIDYMGVLRNSMTSNLLFIAFIWLLGISIIGIPVIVIMMFLKGFMIGFSLAAIVAKYKIIGILGSLTYIFPHIILATIIIFIISYYALRLAFSLLRAVIERKSINFGEVISRYSFVLMTSAILMIVASLLETFISPYILKFFVMFID